jgi:hypothetical protein
MPWLQKRGHSIHSHFRDGAVWSALVEHENSDQPDCGRPTLPPLRAWTETVAALEMRVEELEADLRQ